MPILSPIGRKHPRVRALIALIYLLLVAGGLTMIYPFALMLSGSTKSGVDVRDLDLIPAYLRNDEALYRKYIEGLFNESLDLYRIAYDTDDRSFEAVSYSPCINKASVADWRAFTSQYDLPDYAILLGFVHARVSLTTPHMLREFKHAMLREHNRDVHIMNRALGTDFVTWNAFFVMPENYYSRLRAYTTDRFQERYRQFKAEQGVLHLTYASVQGFYKTLFLKTRFGRDVAEYNAAHGTAYDSYADLQLARTAAALSPAEQATWEVFVRQALNLLWIRLDESATDDYHAYLQAKYTSIDVFNRHYATSFATFNEIPLPTRLPASGIATTDWDAFIKGWSDPDSGQQVEAPLASLRIHSPEFAFQDYLQETYGDIDAVNMAWGTAHTDFAAIAIPQRDLHAAAFHDARRALRTEFTTRNYRTVLGYLVFHGRGVLNTTIYCTLAVLLALIVNPMAAYAMSRYRMPTTYKILLFLLLTMAFPPIVTQIPVFLMLRDFNLLNTFAALVLPGMAHGYSIFLLKGFFDSLPRELYESASIDGANEWTMFWHISMSLSKPILAVIALNAFTQAYSNFMFALLICQDEQMWTLMVWLYQLQMRSGQGVIYASLIIAAIPTFIIFFFCQNIILRGIVVPVEK